jgi:hypothetical protein
MTDPWYHRNWRWTWREIRTSITPGDALFFVIAVVCMIVVLICTGCATEPKPAPIRIELPYEGPGDLEREPLPMDRLWIWVRR